MFGTRLAVIVALLESRTKSNQFRLTQDNHKCGYCDLRRGSESVKFSWRSFERVIGFMTLEGLVGLAAEQMSDENEDGSRVVDMIEGLRISKEED